MVRLRNPALENEAPVGLAAAEQHAPEVGRPPVRAHGGGPDLPVALVVQYLEAPRIADQEAEGLVRLHVLGLARNQPAGDWAEGLGVDAAVGGEDLGEAGVGGPHVSAHVVALALVGLYVLQGDAAEAWVGEEGGGFVAGAVGVNRCDELISRIVFKGKIEI